VAVVVRVGNEHGMAIGVQDLGIQYLFAVIMIAGLIQSPVWRFEARPIYPIGASPGNDGIRQRDSQS
jgi:hypothetical protein